MASLLSYHLHIAFFYSSLLHLLKSKTILYRVDDNKKDSPTPISIHKEFECFSRKDTMSFPWLFVGTFFLFWIRFPIAVILASTLMFILLYKLAHLKIKGIVSNEERPSFKYWIYAEVAREIYCKIGGFKKSDRTLRASSRYDKSMRDGKYYETNSI